MEKAKSNNFLLFSLVLLAGLLYLACVPWAELRGSDESVLATVAREMVAKRSFFRTTFQGENVGIFPLYPWLIALFHGMGLPEVFAVRLPAVLSVFGMALQAAFMARKHRDGEAGALAALIVLTSFGAMRVGILGQTETLHACLLSCAWFSWHSLGAMGRRWSAAWGVALGFVALDVLTIGLRAILLFYLPFFFTAMPPRTRRMLRFPAHLYWLVAFALVLYLWVTLLCPQPLFAWNALVGPLSASALPEGFLHHLFFFPFRCFRDLMPWGLFLWMPFCLALRPLEPTGSLCGFLRTAVLCLFIFYWILPDYSSLLMMPALPAMAVMISFNLPIVLHRHERQWGKILLVAGILSSLQLFYAVVSWFWVAMGRTTFANTDMAFPVAVFGWLVVGVLLLAGVCFWCRGHKVDAARIAWCVAGMRLAFVALFLLPLFLTIGDRRHVARRILGESRREGAPQLEASQLPGEHDTVYLYSEDSSFPAQMFYLCRPVRRLRKAEDLPKAEEVFLVSARQPLFPGWNWEKVSGPVDFQMHRQLRPDARKLDWRMFLWNYPGREYARTEMLDEDFPDYARKYYEPRLMNLYRGTYRGGK